MPYTFKIINYNDGVFTSFTTTTTSVPVVGDAILDGTDYYVVLHHVINEVDTWLVTPFMANPNPIIP